MSEILKAELIADVSNFVRNLRQAASEGQRTAGLIDKATDSISNAFTSKLSGVFSAAAVITFTKSVMDATAEYQKFDAVLSNTLGSKQLASIKLQEIATFAAQTPFGINELTASFVKLANAGFKPTSDEMRKLGDLASSTGKSFDQLAEAIIDAQTGEFERLKEFGVRAKDAGDSVVFTYKGVQTQVEKTSSSIRDYITALGAAEGTSGSMAKISETLGGKISNLGDTWDQMLISFGKNTEGVFSSAINLIGEAISRVTEYNNQINTVSKYKLGDNTGEFFKRLNRAVNPFADRGATDLEKTASNIQGVEKTVSNFVSKLVSGAKDVNAFGKAMSDLKKQGDLNLSLRTAGSFGAEVKKQGLSFEQAMAKTKGMGFLQTKEEVAAVKKIYEDGFKAIRDARENFTKESKIKDANFGAGKKEKADKSGDQDANFIIALQAKLKAQEDAIFNSRLANQDREVDAERTKNEALRIEAQNSIKNKKALSDALVQIDNTEAAVIKSIDDKYAAERVQLETNTRAELSTTAKEGLNRDLAAELNWYNERVKAFEAVSANLETLNQVHQQKMADIVQKYQKEQRKKDFDKATIGITGQADSTGLQSQLAQLKKDQKDIEEQFVNGGITLAEAVASYTENLGQQQILNDIINFDQQIKNAIENFASNTIAQFGDAIGQLIAAGDVSDSNFGAAILKTIAGFLSSLGQMMIKEGTAQLLFGTAKNVAMPGSGIANYLGGKGMIAAGLGLTIGGGMLSGSANKSNSSPKTTGQQIVKQYPFANGGIVHGPTNALIGEYAGASTNPEVVAPLNTLKSYLPDPQQSGGVIIPEITLRGEDIRIAFNRAEKRNGGLV